MSELFPRTGSTLTRRRNRLPAYLLLAAAIGGLNGCASMAKPVAGDAAAGAPVVTPPSTAESQVLGMLGAVSAGEAVVLMDGVRATPEPVYAAASGRDCRWVTLHYPAQPDSRRLACAAGPVWQWVATVSADLSR